MSNFEQRLCVKFRVLLEISFPILHVIKSPDDETAINLTSVYEWHRRFEKGRQSIDDDEMSGWPPASITVEQISIFKKKCRICLSKICCRDCRIMQT
ncbi:hypothetical protein AVEN_4462-1 [Araneus ventricosus]|uniref:Mos1 transposase HTH domain-containing protein n=1 Tax=Araneus ventricosus TaxID=182803 RepID=A0A4Y2UQA7_ARAVE|nr:hypothetical protein AVEN_4462-1 [Araneus ventricosus]